MASIKNIKGLPYNLAHSFFSTLNYFEKGYMSDWVVNSAIELDVNEVIIDILNKSISPNKMEIKPLTFTLGYLTEQIHKYLKSIGFPSDFIKEAKFIININDARLLICKTILTDINHKDYKSKKYVERSYEIFKVFI